MSKNDLSMAYAINGIGRRKLSTVLRTVLAAIADRSGVLDDPRLSVTWKWRNTPAQAMRSAPLQQTIDESRDGFVGLMEGRIERDLEIALAREASDARRKPPAKTWDRSAAARKGWVTRRRNARQRKAATHATASTRKTRARKTRSRRVRARRRATSGRR